MVRWRACLVLAVLLLLPRTGGLPEEEEDDDESKQRDNADESDEEDDDDDDEEEQPEKREPPGMPGRRALIPPPRLPPAPNAERPRQRPQPQSRGAKNLPFECFVCSYKNAAPLRSCLDPVKYRVHSVTCHNLGDKCFTTVTSKDKSFEEITRGCRTGCVDTANTKCCEANRCNNQAFAMPLEPETLVRPLDENTTNKATKSPPPSVLFFVTILLLLQTVVKAKLRIRKNKTSAMPKSETLDDEPDEFDDDKATKPPPPSVLFFVTILLLLQTVVKVSFV